MIYLDTSAVISAITDEADSDRIWNWLDNQDAGTLFVSDWTRTEVSSALSIKVRTGQLSVDDRAVALSSWRRFLGASLSTLGCTVEHFRQATLIADRHDLGVRAPDALHIAIAAAAGFRLVTLDRTMAAAAPLLGVPLEPLD